MTNDRCADAASHPLAVNTYICDLSFVILPELQARAATESKKEYQLCLLP